MTGEQSIRLSVTVLTCTIVASTFVLISLVADTHVTTNRIVAASSIWFTDVSL